MKATWGQIKRLLGEASEDDWLHEIDYRSAPHVRLALVKRFKAWVFERFGNVDESSSSVQFRTYSIGMPQDVDVFVKWNNRLFDPRMTVFHQPKDVALPDELQKLNDDVIEHAVPVPCEDGFWWADKDTYELMRPIVEGELWHFPPHEEWCAYDPTKGKEV